MRRTSGRKEGRVDGKAVSEGYTREKRQIFEKDEQIERSIRVDDGVLVKTE